MKFSGHETFALRYAWLPKAYRYLEDPKSPGFSNEDAAMVALGLGKNMVRALRFWVEAFGLAESDHAGVVRPSPLAHLIFGPDGVDPFLEDPRTLWLLHWHISVRPEAPICAWDILINRWPKAEFTKSEAMAAFLKESERRSAKGHSQVTLAQHLDVFLHTYVSSRHTSGNIEETLDSPLVELGLIEYLGERRAGPDGKPEPVYSFQRGPKGDVTPQLFAYIVDQVFTVHKAEESTRTFRELLVGPYSPGQVFRLAEEDLRSRLEQLGTSAPSTYIFQLSAVQSVLQRDQALRSQTPLERQNRQKALIRAAFRAELGES